MTLKLSGISLLACLLIASGATAWRFHARFDHASALHAPPGDIVLAGNTMGGTWSVKINRVPAGVSRDSLRKSVAEQLARLDAMMSIWKPGSDLSRFNQSRGDDWFPVPKELAEVVSTGNDVSRQTDGAFDATVGPLVLLWGFGPNPAGGQTGRVPPRQENDIARSHVDYRLLECRLSPPALRKHDPDVYIDLGGIAKGYAAEAVAADLAARGIDDYLVAVGGELRAHGFSATGQPWRVGIETPTADVRRIFYSLPLKDASLSTSGDYRNFFEIDGVRYCHEIDPRTGRPIAPGLASVSIVHSSGTYADAMATALMVLGPRDGYELAVRRHLAVLFIVRTSDHFQPIMTPEFERLGGPIAAEGK